MPAIHIDEELCTQCGRCVTDCVPKVMRQGAEGRIVAKHEALCIRCGHCVAVCPVGAISHDTLGQDDFEEVTEGMNIAPNRLRDFLRARRSVRAYYDRAVPRSVTEELIELARWVPTASNSQNVAFTIVEDREVLKNLSERVVASYEVLCRQLADPAEVERMISSVGAETVSNLTSGMGTFQFLVSRYRRDKSVLLWDAPAMLLAHAESVDHFGRDNCVLATYNFMLGAASRGLGTCWIGFIVRAMCLNPSFGELVGLPSGHTIHTACVFGYPRYGYERLVPRNSVPTRWV